MAGFFGWLFLAGSKSRRAAGLLAERPTQQGPVSSVATGVAETISCLGRSRIRNAVWAYTGLDGFVPHQADGIHIGGIFSGMFYLAGLLAVFSYNLWICAYLARLQRQ